MIQFFGMSDEMKTTRQKNDLRESPFDCHRRKMIKTGWGMLFALDYGISHSNK